MTDADYITIKFVLERAADVAKLYLPNSGKTDREDIDRAKKALERAHPKPQPATQEAMF